MIGITWLATVGLLVQGLDARGLRHTAPLGAYVRLSLKADRDAYYKGELIRLQITATNISQVPVSGYFAFDPLHPDTKIYCRTPGSSDFRELNGLRDKRVHDSTERQVLKPGQSHSETAEIAVTNYASETRAFILDGTGPYDFQVKYVDTPEDPSSGSLDSDLLTIEVVSAPASEQAAQANYTPALAYAAQFRWGLSFLSSEETRAAADFIERFPQSRYTVSVAQGLRRSLDYRIRANRATDDERLLFQRLFFDSVAPVLSVSALPVSLWPPNHKLVAVSVGVHVTDDHDPSPSVKLVSITCDDACDPALDIVGPGYGADLRQFQLRSERKGTSTAGRTYTITYSATDASGNSTTATTKVTVPHDQGKTK